ncbi:hypothetical protein PROFUN_03558 [Planoprotostelium fungivorum]|uniref:U6 snRNA-associated Sm-like protein LSm4 n=1 Tax=Planoprotostelium fungivorum TaxID=1890364 RepID=A0A2P6MSG6_9EUKA|nr:hypothetical protein PROFUN_03558 [Planoprotostelium fungivorum]
MEKSVMLPLSLLRTAQGHPVLVELKNGDTYNGYLVSCDSWMNINLRRVIHTSKDGDQFWKIAECYVRGNTIKFLGISDEVINLVQKEEEQAQLQPEEEEEETEETEEETEEEEEAEEEEEVTEEAIEEEREEEEEEVRVL